MGDQVLSVYGAFRDAGASERQARLATATISSQQERIEALESKLSMVAGLLVFNTIVIVTLALLHLSGVF